MGENGFSFSGERKSGGFTLLEILVTVVVVVLMLGIVITISDSVRKNAEKVKCVSNMKTLHASFMAYMEDVGHWPQLPGDEDKDWTEEEFFRFFILALEPYGTAKDTWLCPSDKVMIGQKKLDQDESKEFFGSYVPTRFDERANTPFRWNQPWIVERGDLHGKGAHILMPDGSIHDSQNPFYGR